MADLETTAGKPKDPDVGLPKAPVHKVVREMFPSDARLSTEVKDLLADCCTEFITLVSSEANELCDKEKKSTLTPEHVLTALENLGFTSYLEEVKETLKQHKAAMLDSPKPVDKWAKAGPKMSEAEAIAAQQKMFAEARARMQVKSGEQS